MRNQRVAFDYMTFRNCSKKGQKNNITPYQGQTYVELLAKETTCFRLCSVNCTTLLIKKLYFVFLKE